jgi:hypothetical protein
VVAVSRKGGGSAAREGQLRVFRDRNILVLAVSDEQVLEMVSHGRNEEKSQKIY